MNNSLSSAVPRRASRAVAALTLSAAMAFGYLVGIAQAHDPRLDEAFQALQKAYALVEASQTGGAPPQVQHQFDGIASGLSSSSPERWRRLSRRPRSPTGSSGRAAALRLNRLGL